MPRPFAFAASLLALAPFAAALLGPASAAQQATATIGPPPVLATPAAPTIAAVTATPERQLAVVDAAYVATARANAGAAATAAALATALSTRQADLESAQATLAAANSAATAQAATAEAQETALATESAARATAESDATRAAGAAEATGSAFAARVAETESTVTAVAAQAATAEATSAALSTALATRDAELAELRARAAAGESTATALGTTVAATESDLADLRGRLAAAEATIASQGTAIARAERAVAAGLNPSYTQVSIDVDAAGLIAGDPAAIGDARGELRRALAPYRGECRVGVALTFGHGATINDGVALAAAINRILPGEAPALFNGAALDAFGDLSPPLGRVDLRLYFFSGCPAAGEATPTASS